MICNKFATDDEIKYKKHNKVCEERYSEIFKCEYCDNFEINHEKKFKLHIKTCKIKYSDPETTHKKCFNCKETKLLKEFNKDNTRG